MKKNIQLCFVLLVSLYLNSQAQEFAAQSKAEELKSGYYQSVNFDDGIPCNCNQKTQRTHDLNKALGKNDVIYYSLHAYRFNFGDSPAAMAKLFKALEGDASVYKVSMKEWDAFMLLTTADFDVASFEAAARIAFHYFESMPPADFLKSKSQTSYEEYMSEQAKRNKISNEAVPVQGTTH